MTNYLYYGDNLDVLRESIQTESVDLVYLDPPFNSNRSYNVLFQQRSGADAQAQIEAFDDTWTWSPEAEQQYLELVSGGGRPSRWPTPSRRCANWSATTTCSPTS